MREFLSEIAEQYVSFWVEALPFVIAVVLIVATLFGLFWLALIVMGHILST